MGRKASRQRAAAGTITLARVFLTVPALTKGGTGPNGLARSDTHLAVAPRPGIQEEAMCDYSLEVYGTQPAREGERYVTTRFPSGTIGLTAFGGGSTAVCVQCDTKLMLENIPDELQETFGVSAREEVTFIRLDRGPYRDGVRFENGKEISFQQLKPGVTVSVTRLLEFAAPRFEAVNAL